MQDFDLRDMWFQQDGGTWHPKCAKIDVLRGELCESYISRSGPANWQPRSCDLTPLLLLLRFLFNGLLANSYHSYCLEYFNP